MRLWHKGLDLRKEYRRYCDLVAYLPRDILIERIRRESKPSDVAGIFVPRSLHASRRRVIRISGFLRTRGDVLATLAHETAHAAVDHSRAPKRLRRGAPNHLHGVGFREAFRTIALRAYGFRHRGRWDRFERNFEAHCRKWARSRQEWHSF